MKRSISKRSVITGAILCLFLTALTSQSAMAAQCGNTSKGFQNWLSSFKRQMIKRGISARTVNASLGGLTYDHRVIRLDRSQKSFKQDFNRFYKRRTKAMVPMGKRRMRRLNSLFTRIEKKYGVPRAMLTAIWGLETSFGKFMGKRSIMRSLATLSYDCRRSDFFTQELIAALTIVNRGDVPLSQMRGAWAGEIGQTQFLATRYVKYAVSFDGDRRKDLYRSVPDALASTANWFRGNGWRRGEDWSEGTHNYGVIMKWNRATVYQRTIAKLAHELARPSGKKRRRR